MPRKLNTPPRLSTDLGSSFLYQIVHCVFCGTQKPSFGHYGHIHGQVPVGQFQLYLTSVPCHSSRHVEYLQEISYCFKQWYGASTLPINTSVATSEVIKACFVHSWGCLSGTWSAKIPQLATSWWSISRSEQAYALFILGCFPLRTAITWSHSLLQISALCHSVNWWLFTTVWIYSHQTACCILFMLRPVLRTIISCTLWIYIRWLHW